MSERKSVVVNVSFHATVAEARGLLETVEDAHCVVELVDEALKTRDWKVTWFSCSLENESVPAVKLTLSSLDH